MQCPAEPPTKTRGAADRPPSLASFPGRANPAPSLLQRGAKAQCNALQSCRNILFFELYTPDQCFIACALTGANDRMMHGCSSLITQNHDKHVPSSHNQGVPNVIYGPTFHEPMRCGKWETQLPFLNHSHYAISSRSNVLLYGIAFSKPAALSGLWDGPADTSRSSANLVPGIWYRMPGCTYLVHGT